MSYWKTLLITSALLYGVAEGSPVELEQEISDALMRQLVEFVSIGMQETNIEEMEFSHSGKPYVHNLSICYAMAWLYKNPHPLNPYYGKTEIRDEAIAYCDCMAEKRLILEWPMYAFCQVYGLIKDELPEVKKRLWRDYAGYYINTRGRRPYFYTSFNHESYNALAVLRAGQVFNNRQWEQQGGGLMRQLIKIQTEPGYFNEGPGHGPSMKYNQVQLSGMLLFADYSGDEEVLRACQKLAEFMIRYSFPDGSTIGTLDGRQSWSLGYYATICYGLDRWPRGKEHNRRIYLSRKKWNMLDPQSRYYSFSEWYAYFGGWWLLDEYLSLRPDAPSEPLPQDVNGYRMVESGPTFSGGVIRQHDWMIALSAIKPVPGFNIYRLERQSRLDVWHQKTGLIIGGGHNKIETDIPLANCIVLTGYGNIDCDFGLITGGNWHDKRAVYFPRNVKASLSLEKQVLHETFGQGDVSFTVQPIDKSHLSINFDYDVFSVDKMFVQLPLIVYYDSEVLVDGRQFEGDTCLKIEREVLISNPTMGSKVRITVPENMEAKLRPPISPLRWYGGDHGPQRYEPFYQINLLSVKVDSPRSKGSGKFMLEILD